MRIVFMGTPDFAVPTLEALIKSSKHEVTLVVTQPDKPKGRGKEVKFSPVKELAVRYQVPVFQPKKVKEEDSVQILHDQNPDVIIVAAFGQILSKEILDLPKYGCINVHASLLPKYRGSSPIQQVILDGEKETGLTAMMMDIGIDTGDMLKQVKVQIDPKETGESLSSKLALLGGGLILDVLDEALQGSLVRKMQDNNISSYTKPIDKKQGKIHWSMSADVIERFIRGLNSWPSAYTMLDGKTLKIWDADVVAEEFSGELGSIVKVTKDSIMVKTGKGTLAILSVQLEGKKRMDAASFLRGYPVKEGDYLK